VKAWVPYVVASAGLVVVGVWVAGALFPDADPMGLWVAAALAWGVQAIAFGLLVGLRDGTGFMMAWAGGMALRFGMVGAAALLATRSPVLDAPTTLVGLVGFVFALVLLEPLFLRLAD
jgi:hypothetical protein